MASTRACAVQEQEWRRIVSLPGMSRMRPPHPLWAASEMKAAPCSRALHASRESTTGGDDGHSAMSAVSCAGGQDCGEAAKKASGSLSNPARVAARDSACFLRKTARCTPGGSSAGAGVAEHGLGDGSSGAPCACPTDRSQRKQREPPRQNDHARQHDKGKRRCIPKGGAHPLEADAECLIPLNDLPDVSKPCGRRVGKKKLLIQI